MTDTPERVSTRVFKDAGRYDIIGAIIPAKILGLEGQVIKDVVFDAAGGRVRIICHRAEFKAAKTLGDLARVTANKSSRGRNSVFRSSTTMAS